MGGRPLEDIVSENLSFLYDVYLEHYPKRALCRSLSYLDDLQYFDFDELRHSLAVDLRILLENQISYQVLWVSAACLALPILSLLFYSRRRHTVELSDSPRLRAPLNALLSFLTPTTSVWPENYLDIAKRGLLHSSARLKLPIRCLIRDVLHGTVELRHPAADLPAFIVNTTDSHEWSIAPSLEISWHVYVAFQIFRLRLSRLSPLKSRPPTLSALSPGLSTTTLTTTLTDGVVDPGKHGKAHSIPVMRSSSSGMTMLMLDAIPYAHLKAYIRSIQDSLSPGSSAMLGFSTYGDKPSLTSSSFVLAAIPFLARQYVTKKTAFRSGNSTAARCPSLDMEPTPLLTSLDSILRLISSGSSPLVVESVQNVSEQYASFLDRYAQELTDLPKVRDKFVTQWRLAGWREERLMVSWEAALFRAGLMVRWVVLVTRNEHA